MFKTQKNDKKNKCFGQNFDKLGPDTFYYNIID